MICLTGSEGQLGLHIQNQLKINGYEYLSLNKNTLDITNNKSIKKYFEDKNISLLINAAAYTNVDKAESDSKSAFLVNEKGPRYLSEVCNSFDAPIIHISTDYVFDGLNDCPYKPGDKTNPKSVYGKSKLAGEEAIISNANSYILIRTSWVFSEYRKNFFNTIFNLAKKNDTLRVVSDQFGSPTYAGDLAKAIVSIIPTIHLTQKIRATYHYGGDQICTWYDFANEICKEAFATKALIKIPKIIPVSSDEFLTPAKRPKYSALDSSEFCKSFSLNNSNWRTALKNIFKNLESQKD